MYAHNFAVGLFLDYNNNGITVCLCHEYISLCIVMVYNAKVFIIIVYVPEGI